MAKKSTRLEALQDLFKENNIMACSIEDNDALIQKIKGYAETVPDYRHQSYVRHPHTPLQCLKLLPCLRRMILQSASGLDVQMHFHPT